MYYRFNDDRIMGKIILNEVDHLTEKIGEDLD